uniref:Uncharacterized protein n=1 Tax=Anguilla anguilla TaxID=7936 RepID=A0A0E9UT59_ANGAN
MFRVATCPAIESQRRVCYSYYCLFRWLKP